MDDRLSRGRRDGHAHQNVQLILMPDIRPLLDAAVQLLRESSRHFKSRQVAEARRLIEQAIKQIEEQQP